MRVLILFALTLLAVFFGATDVLVAAVIFLLTEISLDVKKQAAGVLEIYRLFEQQVLADQAQKAIDEIDEQLARNSGVDPESGEVQAGFPAHTLFTWPPKLN